jgi:hypothetical protein
MFGANSSGTTFVNGAYLNITSATYSVGTEWTRIEKSLTITNPDVAFLQIRLDGPETFVSGVEVWWDGIQVEKNSSATPFNSKFFGNSTVKNLQGGPLGQFLDFPTLNVFNDNKCFSFVTNDGIVFPNDTNLDTQTPTVEAWIRPNNLDQNAFWFEKGNVNTQYSLFQDQVGTGRIIWRHRIAGVNTNLILSNAPAYLSTTNFTQVVGTYESGSRKLFVNGIKVAEDSITGTIETNAGGSSMGVHGGFSGTRGYWYDGDIASVKVYNRVLTEEEVAKNFTAFRGKYGI